MKNRPTTFLFLLVPALAAQPAASPAHLVRVAAAQAKGRVIDFRLKPNEALAAVENNLSELVHNPLLGHGASPCC